MNSPIARRFNHRAARYDNSLTSFMGELELRQVRKLVPQGSRVLDYGCGTGRTTLDLLRRSCSVTAYDISEGMLSQAKVKSQEMGWEAEFLTDPTELNGRTWPMMTCIGVLDYYPDPLPLLRTLCQLLEDSGSLVITFPNAWNPIGWFYMLGSQFTVPAIARTPGFVRLVVQSAHLRITRLLYALPSLAPIGYTMILALEKC